jgi:hypothetical protein
MSTETILSFARKTQTVRTRAPLGLKPLRHNPVWRLLRRYAARHLFIYTLRVRWPGGGPMVSALIP